MRKPRSPTTIEKQKIRDRAWLTANRDYKKKYLTEFREVQRSTDLEWVLKDRLRCAKGRAKLLKREFTLTEEWLAAQPRHCALTGQPFVLVKGRGPLTPAFDRIDSTKGYTPENTRIILNWINGAKMEWDDTQIQELIISAAAAIQKRRSMV